MPLTPLVHSSAAHRTPPHLICRLQDATDQVHHVPPRSTVGNRSRKCAQLLVQHAGKPQGTLGKWEKVSVDHISNPQEIRSPTGVPEPLWARIKSSISGTSALGGVHFLVENRPPEAAAGEQVGGFRRFLGFQQNVPRGTFCVRFPQLFHVEQFPAPDCTKIRHCAPCPAPLICPIGQLPWDVSLL